MEINSQKYQKNQSSDWQKSTVPASCTENSMFHDNLDFRVYIQSMEGERWEFSFQLTTAASPRTAASFLNLCSIPRHFTPVRNPHFSARPVHRSSQAALPNKALSAGRNNMWGEIKAPIVAAAVPGLCQMLILTGKIWEQFLNSCLSSLMRLHSLNPQAERCFLK